MRAHRAFAAGLVGALLLSGRPAADGVQEEPRRLERLLAGIVRQDGVIVPFAEYRAGEWSAPSSLVDTAEPWFARDGQVPTTWHFQPITGRLEHVTAIGESKVVSHRQIYWGLSTFFRGQAVPANTAHRNIGAAISGNQYLDRPILMPPISIEAASVKAFIRARLEAGENTAARKADTQWLQADPAVKRLWGPIEVGTIFRTPDRLNGRYVYFIELNRKYPIVAVTDGSCLLTAIFQAWVSENTYGAMTLLDSRMEFTDCDRKTPSIVTPFGLLTVDGRWFFIVEELGWEDESYAIVETNGVTFRRVLSVEGGGS